MSERDAARQARLQEDLLDPLDEELDTSTHAVRLNDPDDRTDRVQKLGRRVIHVLPLCDCKKSPVPVQSLLDSLYSTGTTGRNRHGNARIYDSVAKGQDR